MIHVKIVLIMLKDLLKGAFCLSVLLGLFFLIAAYPTIVIGTAIGFYFLYVFIFWYMEIYEKLK